MQAKFLIITAWVSFCAASVFAQQPVQNRKLFASGRFYTQPCRINNSFATPGINPTFACGFGSEVGINQHGLKGNPVRYRSCTRSCKPV